MTLELDDECGLAKYIDSLKVRAKEAEEREILAVNRLVSILFSGALDSKTAGQVQEWANEYPNWRARALQAEEETLEQCRLLGKSGSREAHLLAKIEKLERVERLAFNLVNRLRVIHDDPRYQRMWAHYYNHHGLYKGPSYENELAYLTKALPKEMP